ncbi:MAG: hypothetical protein V4582_22065 [Pseudomonadota bacterium]
MSTEMNIEYEQEGIAPFWQKIPFFLLFPLRGGPLVFMACVIVASALAGLAFGSFGLLIKGSLVYLALRYAFNVLELFAQGRFEGESVDHTLWGPEKRPAKLGLLILLFVVIGMSLGNYLVTKRIATNTAVQEQLIALYKHDHASEIAEHQRELAARAQASARADAAAAENAPDEAARIAPAAASHEAASLFDGALSRADILAQYTPSPSDPRWFSLLPVWYWIVMCLLSLMLPSGAIIIALEDKFFSALNPTHLLSLVSTMGRTYFVLWGLFLAIGGARQMALSAGAGWPMALRFPVEMAISSYLGLVLFAMIGYALYEYHQQLSLDVQVDFDSHRAQGGVDGETPDYADAPAPRALNPGEALEHKVRALLAEQDVDAALAAVEQAMRHAPFSADLNIRLHELYLRKGDPALTLKHGQQLLSALTRAKRHEQALDALCRLLVMDRSFVIDDGDAVMPLMKQAIMTGKFSAAGTLLNGFDKRFPKHKDTAAMLYYGARLASEYKQKDERAIKLLDMVLKHFPNHAIAPEAKRYLELLRDNAQQQQARAA